MDQYNAHDSEPFHQHSAQVEQVAAEIFAHFTPLPPAPDSAIRAFAAGALHAADVFVHECELLRKLNPATPAVR